MGDEKLIEWIQEFNIQPGMTVGWLITNGTITLFKKDVNGNWEKLAEAPRDEIEGGLFSCHIDSDIPNEATFQSSHLDQGWMGKEVRGDD